jgi:hypothetical protein
MIRKSSTRRPIHPAILIALVLSTALIVVAGCSSSRRSDQPAATTTSATSVGAQINENAQGLTVDGLVEYGYSMPHRYRAQGSGQLGVRGNNIEWRSERRKRDFSIQADVLKTATLRCASRPGQNVCLELRLGTITGLDYAFRDTNWAAGHNEKITEVYNYLKANFPQVTFSEQAVKEID